MKKLLFSILICSILLSGCVESPEDKGSRLSEEAAEYNAAFEDGYETGFNENKDEVVKDLEDKIYKLEQQIEDLEWEIGFYEDRVALVTMDDRLIHNYSCKRTSASYYEVLLPDDPFLNSCDPCPDCNLPTWEEIQQVIPQEKPYGPSPTP